MVSRRNGQAGHAMFCYSDEKVPLLLGFTPVEIAINARGVIQQGIRIDTRRFIANRAKEQERFLLQSKMISGKQK